MSGIDTIIEALKDQIVTIAYMNTVYGRAVVMRELWGDKSVVTVPKVHMGGGNYAIPLPKDTEEPQAFFQAIGSERFDEFDRFSIGGINRQIAVTFWGKLGNDDTPDSTEDIKFDFIEKLQKSPYVSKIDSFVDERYQDVFPDFHQYFAKAVQLEQGLQEQKTQWLMQPYGGFRLVFTVNYAQPCQV